MDRSGALMALYFADNVSDAIYVVAICAIPLYILLALPKLNAPRWWSTLLTLNLWVQAILGLIEVTYYLGSVFTPSLAAPLTEPLNSLPLDFALLNWVSGALALYLAVKETVFPFLADRLHTGKGSKSAHALASDLAITSVALLGIVTVTRIWSFDLTSSSGSFSPYSTEGQSIFFEVRGAFAIWGISLLLWMRRTANATIHARRGAKGVLSAFLVFSIFVPTSAPLSSNALEILTVVRRIRRRIVGQGSFSALTISALTIVNTSLMALLPLFGFWLSPFYPISVPFESSASLVGLVFFTLLIGFASFEIEHWLTRLVTLSLHLGLLIFLIWSFWMGRWSFVVDIENFFIFSLPVAQMMAVLATFLWFLTLGTLVLPRLYIWLLAKRQMAASILTMHLGMAIIGLCTGGMFLFTVRTISTTQGLADLQKNFLLLFGGGVAAYIAHLATVNLAMEYSNALRCRPDTIDKYIERRSAPRIVRRLAKETPLVVLILYAWAVKATS